MSKDKVKPIYKGIECDSDEEVYFLMWAFELKEAGYIKDIQRAPTFKLTDGWINEYEEQLKTKVKIKQQTILQPSSYTPDILLTFEDFDERLNWQRPYYDKEKYTELFIGTNSSEMYRAINGEYNQSKRSFSPQALIEVKPIFDQNNMTRLFHINQKQMWDKYRIFVNLVKIPKFFESTFTPKEYMKTATGKDRKIKFKVKTIEEYLKEIEQ